MDGEADAEVDPSENKDITELDALVRWLDSPECSYSGIRDRMLLGHHAMRVAAGLPTFAAYASSSVRVKAETATKAKLREAQRVMDEMCVELQSTRTQLSEERRVLEETLRVAQEAETAFKDSLNKERTAHGEALSAERERLSEERAKMSTQQADVLTRLADIAEARGRLEAREAEARARADAREAEARARAESREADAHARLEAKLAGIHSEEVRKLRAELDRLKGTNHVKGVEGESTVSSALRSAFDSWTFVDTSGSTGSSDFHMVGPRGETLVVEVKNKITVTAQDVTKSQRDVAEIKDRLGDAFLGYLFVSLRCRSIPGKGALFLEAPTSQSVPILWCGLEESGAFEGDNGVSRDVVRAARLLVDFGKVLAARRPPAPCVASSSETSEESERRIKTEAELEEAIGKLNAQLEQLDDMRKIAARLSDSASVTRRHAASMQAAIDTAFASLDSYRVAIGAFSALSASSATPSSSGPPAPGASAQPAGSFECQKCGKVCTSKNGLANHGRFCAKF